jgi:large subunit ribosomal protein L15
MAEKKKTKMKNAAPKKTARKAAPAHVGAGHGRAAVSLSNLRPPKGSRHRKVRVGRGIGSKLGKTAGAGNKGQKSRRGYSRRRGFEGGQMPLHRRMPKRGFHNLFGVSYSVVNLEELNVFPAGETVTPELLRAHGFVRRAKDQIKVLGDGELTTKLAIHAHAFSASARDKITKAGSTFEVVA